MADRLDGSPSLRWEPVASFDLRYRGLRLPPSAREKQALAEALERLGQEAPVLASDGVEPGRLVLLDGYRRVEILESAGVERILTKVVTLDAPASLAAVERANAARQGLSTLEQGWIAVTLRDEHGLTQAAIAELLGHDKTWVCRRLKLVTDLERAVQDDVRVGLLSASTARELVRLPRGNQAAAAAAAVQHGLTSRQTAKLVGVLLATDPALRRHVLADPVAHLPEPVDPRDPAKDPRLGEQANHIRRQLLRVHSAANRLQELLLDPPSFTPSEGGLLGELAGPILSAARGCFARLEAALPVEAEASAERRHAG